jgi:DNA excision repair protein ERCC-2
MTSFDNLSVFFISVPRVTTDMQGLFCRNCKSLMPPGSITCRICGKGMDGTVSNQSCLGGKNISRVREAPKIVSGENADAPYFPYEPRALQMQIVADIREALAGSKHIVMESGTGTGKTIVALAGTLEHAKAKGKRVVYLTRTISQSDQVMKELRAISSIKPVSGITITGRGRSCPLMKAVAGYEDIPPQALSSLCEDRKRKSMTGQAGGCRYFDKLKTEMPDITQYCSTSFPTSESLDAFCEKAGVCPYEAKKILMKDADVVVAPYVHILSEDIRGNLLSNMGLGEDGEKQIVMIVDEAHNIIDAARNSESFKIPVRLVEAAMDECSTLRDPEVADGIKIKDFITFIRASMKALANENLDLKIKEAELKGNILEDRIIARFSLAMKDVEQAVDRLIELGEQRTDLLLEKGENRMSDIFTLGTLLKRWVSSPSDSLIRAIKVDDDGEFLSASCIDPSDITGFMRSLSGAVHMSGTLQPLNQYVRVMGLPRDTESRIYPSPFPPENRSVIYLGNVTTSFRERNADPSMDTRIEKNIARLCNAVEKNTLVFFPSYSLMFKMRPFLERDVKDKALYWEEPRQQKRTMASLDRFRAGRDGVFFTVMGGSIAEGIDFPGDELCFAIIVGIPYPPPSLESDAMKMLFDKRYGVGTGKRYTSEVPALRKMKQAIGRLIRTENDRGMAVILDHRCKQYEKQLDARLSTDPVGDMVRFFSEGDGQY